MNKVEIKPFLDVSTLTAENVPDVGDMPDVSMAYPFSSDILPTEDEPNGNPDRPNGAVFPFRLFLGSEDDENREKVENWTKVDDFAGLVDGEPVLLWAGTYNGTIYLHAGHAAPSLGSDENNGTGTPLPVDDGQPEFWRNGEAVLPFTAVPFDMRDGMLKNEAGRWRRLVWEPVGLFDIQLTKKFIPSPSNPKEYVLNMERYTLWMIVEFPYVCFYSTSAKIYDAAFDDGKKARWPFSYYEKFLRTKNKPIEDKYLFYASDSTIGTVCDGIGHTGITSYFAFDGGYRLAPLPWQIDGGGELEAEDEIKNYDGVHIVGQFYTMPPQYPCGRYLATLNDGPIAERLQYEYRGRGLSPNFEPIDMDVAKTAIVDTVKNIATTSYSIDPAIMEELGRSFPRGVEAGSLWQTDPPKYEVVFSYHIAERKTQYPHWLALMACHAPTALLTASACAHYNEFVPPEDDEEEEGGGGDDDEEGGGDDDENIPPGPTPDDPSGGDNDDPPTETDDDGVLKLPVGFYYEAGNGVQIKREWVSTMPGWRFTIHVDEVGVSGYANYYISADFSTENDSKTYPYNGQQRNMYYGLEASGANITVKWKSSWLGGDNLSKRASSRVGTPGAFTAKISFDDVIATSDVSPDFGGNVLIFTKTRSFTKRGTYKLWNKVERKFIIIRYVKKYNVYRVSARGDISVFAKGYCTANAPERTGSATPGFAQGTSDGLDGPKVSISNVSGTVMPTTYTPLILGDFKPQIIADYEPCSVNFSISGGDQWMVDGKTEKDKGLIDSSIKAELSQQTAYFTI